MVNLFGSLSSGGSPAKKLQQEIEGMELKEQSLISAVQNEIQASSRKLDAVLRKIGMDIYQSHKDGAAMDGAWIGDKMKPQFDEIAEIKSSIAEKEAKIKDITVRYDDEIKLLKSQLTIAQQQATRMAKSVPVTPNDALCGNCGKPFALSVDVFCTNCGHKLDVAPQMAEQLNRETACPNCNMPYTSGVDVFCTGCGYKLG